MVDIDCIHDLTFDDKLLPIDAIVLALSHILFQMAGEELHQAYLKFKEELKHKGAEEDLEVSTEVSSSSSESEAGIIEYTVDDVGFADTLSAFASMSNVAHSKDFGNVVMTFSWCR